MKSDEINVNLFDAGINCWNKEEKTMKGWQRYFSLLAVAVILALTVCPVTRAATPEDDVICAVYVTGIGCGNCAVTDPVLFGRWTQQFPNLVIVEYEIYKQHLDNQDVKSDYFDLYLEDGRPGVPFFLLNKEQAAIGRSRVLKAEEFLKQLSRNGCPTRYGFALDFAEMDFAGIPGKPKIWTKNRVLILEGDNGGNNELLRRLMTTENISAVLKTADYQEVEPQDVLISQGAVAFENAVKIGNWRVQWNGEYAPPPPEPKPVPPLGDSHQALTGMLIVLLLMMLTLMFLQRRRKVQKGARAEATARIQMRDLLVAAVVLISLVAFFLLASNVSPDYLEKTGYDLPLPVFTFLVAVVDGFNPCNMFVLTCLLALLVSTSSSRLRLYIVGFSFVGMVYIFYFTFMAAWLNIFKYIGFVRPLSISLGVIAVIAGLINCKELFFFRRGVTLTISDKHKGPLMQRMDRMKDIIQHGSFPLLFSSSIGLAALASLIELPCTAGFPIIYTGVLSGRGLEDTWVYYAYLLLYNFFYVIPLLSIITFFIYTLKVRRLTQRQMEIMKFVGGVIMLLLGIVLLVNPGLIGIGIGS